MEDAAQNVNKVPLPDARTAYELRRVKDRVVSNTDRWDEVQPEYHDVFDEMEQLEKAADRNSVLINWFLKYFPDFRERNEAWRRIELAFLDPDQAPKMHDIDLCTTTIQTSNTFTLKPKSIRAMEATDYDLRWLVDKVLVASQPCIVGAPKKSMKTSIMVDLAVSLASATAFLGTFNVPRPVRVLMLSGESGEPTIRETYRRVCKARGIDPDELEGMLHFEFLLPKLSNCVQRDELTRVIKELAIDVVIIDPIYLCLISGGVGRVDSANLFDMGPLLQQTIAACLPATALLVHHAKKNMVAKDGTFGRYGQPDLDDLSMAGFQEFARQWILLKRSERYEPGSGVHKLWLSIGGSFGHSGEWETEIDEGTLLDDFTGRVWNVRVKIASEARAEKEEKAAEAKVEKELARMDTRDKAKAGKGEKDARAVVTALTEPMTQRKLRTKLGWGYDRLKIAVALAIENGSIEEAALTGETLLRRVVRPTC
jgi:hypothetical protein